jgi:hypothetical protein
LCGNPHESDVHFKSLKGMHTFTRVEPELDEEGERKAELLDLPMALAVANDRDAMVMVVCARMVAWNSPTLSCKPGWVCRVVS